MSTRFYFFILIGCAILAGCAQEQKKPVVADNMPKQPLLMDPFKFHKMVEVAPGQYYDVMSWGRGATDTGSFLILHSDSAGRKYTTTTGDLNGQIVDVYNADMDIDGHPEILIQAKRKDTINYTTIYAFEFYESKVQKLDFPKLTGSQRKGYRGNDNFYISEGKFIREFPIYEGSGPSAKLTGAKRKFEYSLSNNSFNVKQLSKDSTTVKNKPAAIQTQQKAPEKKSAKIKKTEKKHHHKTETHKKKRKKHHRS
ncbi:PliI family lysozyme inhibitor of I-type lysozyme [Mucilaginibacter sp. UR6-11]|uniref:PliI family lysozyme inhibitor of I-type lysozyme n=1 Tax=Mucilaginibacter sp. UR6-11 TaxID=1435644 RepID=UPI001E339614|nr:PliI family lysozyme inhibitor of I-type lysozyme [Mucilaginibacter sp. UR6-11]MCC8425916.1 PliI family lysozyme inhibitor of I-type lysozyme [Mucilaginibacter sp. UR6-11]